MKKNNFNPQKKLTRAEAVVLVVHTLGLDIDKTKKLALKIHLITGHLLKSQL